MIMLNKLSQDWQGNPVLTQPKFFGLSQRMGMRKSSLGTHASLEEELHFQEENVAEADKVNPNGESEIPISLGTPTVTKRWGDPSRVNCFTSLTPKLIIVHMSHHNWEHIESLQTHVLVSNLINQAKVSQGDLNRRLNYHLSNEGTDYDSLRGRQIGCQCHNQGSESVVVVGVTIHQGDGSTEHRAKGLRPNVSIHSISEGNTPSIAETVINVIEKMRRLLEQEIGLERCMH